VDVEFYAVDLGERGVIAASVEDGPSKIHPGAQRRSPGVRARDCSFGGSPSGVEPQPHPVLEEKRRREKIGNQHQEEQRERQRNFSTMLKLGSCRAGNHERAPSHRRHEDLSASRAQIERMK